MIDEKKDKISVHYQLLKRKGNSIQKNCNKTNEDLLQALSFYYNQVIDNFVLEINNYQNESGKHVTQIKINKEQN